jgi:hypothetical protein
MQRLTARCLLVLLLVGTLSPLALAIGAPAPHACCMRKPMHGGVAPQVQLTASADCCGHDCCRAATRSNWAQAPEGRSNNLSLPCGQLIVRSAWVEEDSDSDSLHSGRSPPQFSIA